SYQKWTLASFLTRIRWDSQEKYYANIAIRADGSSRLAKGNKWAFFPSGGVAWRISEENFFVKRDWLNSLKIRMSYGTVGNSAINPYQTIAGLTRYDYLFGEDAENKIFVYRPSMIPNSDLGWEISRTTNIGIDFGLLNNRISGYVEGYLTKTSDLLMQRTLPYFTGFSQVWQNIGKTENRGIEINIQATTMKTKQFSWETILTFARNWSKITELLGGGDLKNNSWFIGQPLGVFYDYEKIGIWQLNEAEEAQRYGSTPGDIKVKDRNNDGSIGELDKIILGQRDPKVVSSFYNTFHWRNFDAAINLNMTFGYLIHPNTYAGMITRDGLRWMPSSYKFWTPDNPTNEFTRADKLSGYDPFSGTGGYMKGDYIKVQEITIGYNFVSHIPANWGLSKIRLYGQVRNLGYLYKACVKDVTPEAPNFDFNIPTIYTMGINIDF
ncbi:MAG: TonB-dependent receptor, partial [Tannerellaceae bacterium]|nr:TonB-dependent receptor [Tannerellaceae bacterium]